MGIEESKLWKCYKAVPFWVVIAYPIYCPMLPEQSNNGATTNLQLRTERKDQSAIEDLLLEKKNLPPLQSKFVILLASTAQIFHRDTGVLLDGGALAALPSSPRAGDWHGRACRPCGYRWTGSWHRGGARGCPGSRRHGHTAGGRQGKHGGAAQQIVSCTHTRSSPGPSLAYYHVCFDA